MLLTKKEAGNLDRSKETRTSKRCRKTAYLAIVTVLFSFGSWILVWNWYRYVQLADSVENIFEKMTKRDHVASFVDTDRSDGGGGTAGDLPTPVSDTHAGATQVSRPYLKPIINLGYGPIFYNVFVPDTHIRRTKSIIMEQLNEHIMQDPNSTLLYTLIAQKHADAVGKLFRSNCMPPLNCTERARLSVGNEDDTLQALWEYCSSDDVPSTNENDTLVTYIHDKGSFHASLSNEGARKRGTRCALSCRHQMKANPRMCNICTAIFQVIPQYHGSSKWVPSSLILLFQEICPALIKYCH